MSLKLLSGLSVLLLGPAVSFAQSTPHFYVGASAALVRTVPFRFYAASRVGPAATVGVQLTPRWGVETGLLAFWQNDAAAYTAGMDKMTNRTFVLPLLARYTFTDAASRLQVDALGGGSWAHSSFHYQSTYLDSYGQNTGSNYRITDNSVALTLGPQVRYKLGSNFEAKLNIPFNLKINGGGSFSDRLFLAPQLGAQYTFGK